MSTAEKRFDAFKLAQEICTDPYLKDRMLIYGDFFDAVCTVTYETEYRIVDLLTGKRDDAELGKILRDEYERYVRNSKQDEPFMLQKQAD